ncbi:MAG: hypothetical protein ACAH95_15330 [Fimbriimonas sp.]
MSKLTLTALGAILIFLLWSVVVGRGANKELGAYLGMWTGQLSSDDLKMTGYLRLKGANKQFEMHLEGPQQAVDVTGTWALEKASSLVLRATDVKIDDFGGAAKRDPNKPYLDNGDLREAYASPFVLKLTQNKETLESLPLQIGGARFTHRFDRTFGNVR